MPECSENHSILYTRNDRTCQTQKCSNSQHNNPRWKRCYQNVGTQIGFDKGVASVLICQKGFVPKIIEY